VLGRGTTRCWWRASEHIFVMLEVFVRIVYLSPCNRRCMGVDDAAIRSVILDLVFMLCLLLEALQGVEMLQD